MSLRDHNLLRLLAMGMLATVDDTIESANRRREEGRQREARRRDQQAAVKAEYERAAAPLRADRLARKKANWDKRNPAGSQP